jgi:hypothetical protein
MNCDKKHTFVIAYTLFVATMTTDLNQGLVTGLQWANPT